MNIYKRLYNTAYEMLISMKPSSISEEELEEYFVGDSCNPETLREVFISFIRAAQDYSRMPNVIQFENRKVEIGKILHDFDYRYASTLSVDFLYSEFKRVFVGITETSWKLWSNAVIDSANYISKFKDFQSFDSYITQSSDLKTVPLSMSAQIKGMGFAIACLSLKELGYLDYVKPDVHLIDICVELNISSKKPLDVFDAMIAIAKENEITPYKLDKVLWLVCSGNFYKHSIKVSSRKSELISKVKAGSEQAKSTIRLKVHKKSDSNSDVQSSIEKILVHKLEQHLGFSNLANDSYRYFKMNPNMKIKPDLYSEEHRIIGEVYSHIGKLKPSQVDKIEADILKMLVYEKDSGKQFTKFIIVCDDAVVTSIRSNSVIMASAKLYGIKLLNMPLDDKTRHSLTEAMKKQNITT